jgi:hypothetical protein
VAQEEDVEITAWFLLPGVLLIVAAMLMSLLWNRPPAVQTSVMR